jgi:hypothetical protein
MDHFFHTVIEPSIEAIPLLQVLHAERVDGSPRELTQTICRNVYTEFDRKLSRHLAATRGRGFPGFTVTVEVAGSLGEGGRSRLAAAFHDSVPHALRELAERAFTRSGAVELTFRRRASGGEDGRSVTHKRRLSSADIELLGVALDICEELGEAEFLDISGDFSIIQVAPPGRLDPVVMHLRNGTVSVPSSSGPGSAPFQWPIHAFAEHASTNLAVQSYLACVGHAIVGEKEAAIDAFRRAAERRILDFHAARAGRPLDGHWRDAAVGLIARLRAGLGDTLGGIAEDARGIALDLAASLAASAGRRGAMAGGAAEADFVLWPRCIGQAVG